jgi:hypothetical protein
LKGELALSNAIRKVSDEILSLRPDMSEDGEVLGAEKKMVKMAKKIGLLTAGAAAQKYMQKLSEEQEVVALISDIVIEIFAMESVLLRTLKKMEKDEEGQSGVHIAATRVYINDAFPRVEMMARQVFAAVSEGEELRTRLMALKRLAKYTPINTVALRREIAASAISAGRYNLTKL